MLKSVYTNTGKPAHIVGLLALTVGLAYCNNHSDEIVEGAVNLAKSAGKKIESAFHGGKEKVHKVRMDRFGRIWDTGETYWR